MICSKSPESFLDDFLIKDIIQDLKEREAFIAGGSIVSWQTDCKIRDYDVFFQNKEDQEFVAKKCVEILKINSPIRYSSELSLWMEDTDFSTSIKGSKKIDLYWMSMVPIQLIHYRIGDIEQVLDSFDISACKLAYNFKTEKFIFTNEAKESFKTGIIHFNAWARPFSTVNRLIKYYEKGFKPLKEELPALEFLCKFALENNKPDDIYYNEDIENWVEHKIKTLYEIAV